MMARSPSRTLKLTYLGDASQLSQTTRDAEQNVSTLGDRVRSVGRGLAVGFAAVGAAGVVMGRNLFNAFEEVTAANNRIEQVVTSMGNFEGQVAETTERITAQAEAMARLTGVDRNLIKESQALLLTFNSVNQTADEAGSIFDRATAAAVDLAAAGFGSATSNAQSLGRALEDPIAGLTSLTRQGVTFTEAERELIRELVEANNVFEAQSLILTAIETQVGGVAEATASGSSIIGQSFGILRDRIAQDLAPAFERLVDYGVQFVDNVARWWDRNGDRIIESFRRFGERVRDGWNAMRDFLQVIREGRDAQLVEDAEKAVRSTTEAFNRFVSIVVNAFKGTNDFDFALENLTHTITEQHLKGWERWDRIGMPIVERFLDLLERISALSTRMRGTAGMVLDAYGVPAGVNPFPVIDPAVTPSAAAPTTNVTVNVTGAIDPEGTARTIERVLDDGRLRGTITSTQFTGGL